MRKILVAIALALPLSAFAVAATATPAVTGATRSLKLSCASGACDAPASAALAVNLSGVANLDVIACAASGQTLTGGTITLYYFDPALGPSWLTKGATYSPSGTGVRCAYFNFDSPGKGLPILSQRGSVGAKLDLTVSAGALEVYLLASDANGNLL